jgi:hypothetical protein
MSTLRVGDMLGIEGRYVRRTFWQWLTRQPRVLQVYTVVDDVSADLNLG